MRKVSEGKSSVTLYPHQLEALKEIRSGCVLCGGVGSGKSLTAIAWYYILNNGDPVGLTGGIPSVIWNKKLYVVTTARKRDTGEWNEELEKFGIDTSWCIVDSWNNIGKYTDVEGAVFLFDEQRVVGSGQWVKSFLKIAKKNQWILLSATPGDTWSDYIPLFLANGFFKNRTEFLREHAVYSPYITKYPKIDRYVGTSKLERLRRQITVTMDVKRKTIRHSERVTVGYDQDATRTAMRSRWNPYRNEPMRDAAEMCMVLRRIANEDPSRIDAVKNLLAAHPKAIIFYNFDYELEILRTLREVTTVAEWNGHRHEKLPRGNAWVYLVQYTAGAEGWNCTDTDTIIFYSLNYSYKLSVQAAGRIDRLNTTYRDLWYFRLVSSSPIDRSIENAVRRKRNFNERGFVGSMFPNSQKNHALL